MFGFAKLNYVKTPKSYEKNFMIFFFWGGDFNLFHTKKKKKNTFVPCVCLFLRT